MGCASSGRRVLCKGQGVENDKMGMTTRPKAPMADVANMQPDVHSAVADATRNGADIMGNITDRGGGEHITRRMAFQDPPSIQQRIGSFENHMMQSGADTLGDFATRGGEHINTAVESMEEFSESVEAKVKSGAEDLVNTGKTAVEDVAHNVETEVTKITDSIGEQVEEVKDKAEKAMADLTKKGEDTKGDMGEKIDALLASIDDS